MNNDKKCKVCGSTHGIGAKWQEKFLDCPVFFSNKMEVLAGIKRLMSEKYPDIINEIYEED